MEYKEFTIKAFQREPGKWRASIQCETRRDVATAQAALLMAMVEVDAIIFPRQSGKATIQIALQDASVAQ